MATKRTKAPKLHPAPSVQVVFSYGRLEDASALRFHFYQDTGTGGAIAPRYVALCSTVGCEGVFGEGMGWHAAMSDCLSKLAAKGILAAPPPAPAAEEI